MPRKCTICEHDHVEAINEEIIKGTSFRDIALRYNVNFMAVSRHKEKHIPAGLLLAQEAKVVAQADTLLSQVKDLQTKAWSLLQQAERAGDLRTALQGVREAKGCLELLAKLQGELAQEGTINITLAPEWLELRAVILHTLEPYPEARLQLAQAVREVESYAGK